MPARSPKWPGLTICNGPAFDDRGAPLPRRHSPPRVDVFDLNPATGTLTGRRGFPDFSEAQVWPDGMTVVDEGMLCVARGRAVRRYRADGTLDAVVEIPTRPTVSGSPTHCSRKHSPRSARS